MKNKLVILVLVTMMSSILPTSAFAQTTNTIDRVVTGEDGDELSVVPVLTIADEGDFDGSVQVFKIILDNAEFSDDFGISNITVGGVALEDESKLTILTSTEAIVEVSPQAGEDIKISLNTTLVSDENTGLTLTDVEDDEETIAQFEIVGEEVLEDTETAIALDTPAYISDGYTMLPVRAVAEALSSSVVVRWEDETKTVVIQMGSRVIQMTVGSTTMNIDGVEVEMAKACEITDNHAFISLRDLGYALGLSDDKINWDEETQTATLN